MPNYSRKNRNAILHASPQSSGHRQVNISARIAIITLYYIFIIIIYRERDIDIDIDISNMDDTHRDLKVGHLWWTILLGTANIL